MAYIGALIFAILGLLHLVYTVLDTFREPRYFQPRDKELLEKLKETTPAIAKNGWNYWRASLGFHFSHSLGVLLMALLIQVATLYEIVWVQLIFIIASVAYTLIAWRFWFRTPFIGCLVATFCLLSGWIFNPFDLLN
jgi:hypothetical protein